ncbi:hypothetical protein F2P56_006730, partial [Juglans regia]
MAEMSIRNHKLNAELYEALLSGDADKVKELCARAPEQGLHILTIHDDTVLHVATYSKQAQLVLDLLDDLPPQHLDKMTRQNHQGNTILHEAVISKSQIDVVKKVLDKAPGLLCMRNHLGETALFRAVRHGKDKVFKFLAGKISGYNLANQQLFLRRSDKSTILHVAIVNEHFDLALLVAKMFPRLVGERDADGMTDLQLLSCNATAFEPKDKGKFFQQIINFGSFIAQYLIWSCYCCTICVPDMCILVSGHHAILHAVTVRNGNTKKVCKYENTEMKR